MYGCFGNNPPHVFQRRVVSLFDDFDGFNPSIVPYKEGFLISKRSDWVNGCGTKSSHRIRKTRFLFFDSRLNFLSLVSEHNYWVDVRLFQQNASIYASFLPTKKSCHSCLWNTHLTRWSDHLRVNSCARTVDAFCGKGRNHAFISPTEYLESIDPIIVFRNGTKLHETPLHLNKTCPYRLSLTSPLVKFNSSSYIGIGHTHRKKSIYTRFGSEYTHFFFLFHPPDKLTVGREWCISSRGKECDESVQFASGLAESYDANEYVVTYGSRDCTSRGFFITKSRIEYLLAKTWNCFKKWVWKLRLHAEFP